MFVVSVTPAWNPQRPVAESNPYAAFRPVYEPRSITIPPSVFVAEPDAHKMN